MVGREEDETHCGELRLYRRESTPSVVLQESIDAQKGSWDIRVLGAGCERELSSSTLSLILLGEWSVSSAELTTTTSETTPNTTPSPWSCCSCFYPEEEEDADGHSPSTDLGLARANVAPVTLNLYSVGTTKSVKRINQVTSQFGGLFHAGVQVYGREWTFVSGTGEGCCGIVSCAPTKCPLHSFRESVYLGDCELTKAEVGKVLQAMRENWQGASYDLLHKNCCSFSNTFVKAIGISQGIPKRVDRFARIAASLDVTAQTKFIRISSAESFVGAKVAKVFRARKRRRKNDEVAAAASQAGETFKK